MFFVGVTLVGDNVVHEGSEDGSSVVVEVNIVVIEPLVLKVRVGDKIVVPKGDGVDMEDNEGVLFVE